MRLHPLARAHEQLTEIVRDYEGAGELVSFRMVLGDKDVSKDFDSGSLSVGIDALPWTLSANLAGRVPIRLLNAPVKLYCEVAGIMMPLFSGAASYPQPSAEWATDLTALTPGAEMDRATLDSYVTYSGRTPEAVIRDALYRVPSYDRGQISITPFQTPLIYRIRESAPADTTGGSWASGFEDEDTAKSILDSVLSEVTGISVDTPFGGNETTRDPGIGEGSEIAWDYEANSNEVLEPFVTPSWADPDSQITHVVVRDKYEDGTYRIPPEEWPVDYTGLEFPPTTRNTLYIPLSDKSAEALENARTEAVRTANSLTKGLWSGDITVAFNMFLAPLDVITIGHDYEDDTGRYRRFWRCVIESMEHGFGTEELSTHLTFRAALLQDRRIPDLPILLAGVSSGVVEVPGEGIAYGHDDIGEWVDPSKIGGTPWAGVETISGQEYDWEDPALAPAGLLGEDEFGEYIED